MNENSRTELLKSLLASRIVLLDGAMGTMIQSHKLTEADYRGARFADFPHDLRGNNDLLTLTQPQVIRSIHEAYLEAGADIVETNTFNSNAASMADYHMQDLVYELNFAGVRLAREAADAMEARTPERPRFVAGVLGPTTKTASISPDVNDPGFRGITFDQLVTDYTESIRGLVDAGADILLVETIFDTLNAKAALFAIDQYFEDHGVANTGDDFGHNYRRVGTYAVWTNAGSILEFCESCASIVGGTQLCAGCRINASVYRRTLPRCWGLRQLAP